MQVSHITLSAAAIVLSSIIGCSSSKQSVSFHPRSERDPVRHLSMPWREAGLTEQQAAAHLLERLTFGPRPGEVDSVASVGVDRWMIDQLNAALPEPSLNPILDTMPALRMNDDQIMRCYAPAGVIARLARKAGILPPADSSATAVELARKDSAYRVALARYERDNGYRPEYDLLRELGEQKLFRALYSRNQLQEVLTDFWFNHFNVSLTTDQARPFILSYERDAIRPNVLGHFRDLLGATARHPAMLYYLNTAESTAPDGAPTTSSVRIAELTNHGRPDATRTRRPQVVSAAVKQGRKGQTINENYGREVMELHTLGVDGGYTQRDVTEVSRAFTGWSVFPFYGDNRALAKKVENGASLGFVRDGDFLFRADRHDAGEKHILGRAFPAGGGIDDGERVLDILAASPATARHISYELASRFVCDSPPQSIVDRLTGIYLATKGDLRALVIGIVDSPEFWTPQAIGAKIKSPFELAVSALRAAEAAIIRPQAVIAWIAKMGEPLYACEPPTGYPDSAGAWISSGALLDRMDFGMKLAMGDIPGARVDPAIPGSSPADDGKTILRYSEIFLPEQNPDSVAVQLGFALPDSDQGGRVRNGATSAQESQRLLGIVIGSPQFQRH